jgi:hypothetical protein
VSDWNKSNLRAASEIGGALVVLIGLVFVGIELRQNTSAVEAATVQSLTDASNEFILTIASDPDLVRVWNAGLFDSGAMDEKDYARFFLLARSYWLRMQNAYSQYERGTLGEDDWSVYETLICGADDGIDSGDGLRDTVSDHEYMLRPRLVEIIRNCSTN